jgi:hypothetical protein
LAGVSNNGKIDGTSVCVRKGATVKVINPFAPEFSFKF